MESVKVLVDGYCQITGRPAFTITVDEYIKFHQLASCNQQAMVSTSIVANNEQIVNQLQEKKLESPSTYNKSQNENIEQTKVEQPSQLAIKKESSFRKEEKPKVVVTESKPKQMEKKSQEQTALEMLKSIKG